MAFAASFEGHAARIAQAGDGHEELLQLVLQVRDSIEIVHTSEYPVFLKVYFSTFTALLSERSKPMSGDPHEQKLRMAVLEILNRLPQNEILRPYVADLLKLAMQILTTDTEEAALVCLRIIFDAHKNFRPDLSQEVNPFLDFVQAIYRNLPETLQTLEEASRRRRARAGGEGTGRRAGAGRRTGTGTATRRGTSRWTRRPQPGPRPEPGRCTA
jgi:transformation/transcription domain-associated protein